MVCINKKWKSEVEKKKKMQKVNTIKLIKKNRKVLKIKRKQLPPKMGEVEIEHKN